MHSDILQLSPDASNNKDDDEVFCYAQRMRLIHKEWRLTILAVLMMSTGCQNAATTDMLDFAMNEDASDSLPSTDLYMPVDALVTADTQGNLDQGIVPSNNDAQAPRPSYPEDDELRVNHLQTLGTHNSYHIAPDLMFLPWNYTHLPLDQQLGSQGVRQFELDIYQNQMGTFDVYHILFADDGTTCATLTECLRVMKRWSDQNPGHHPILVLIEPKGTVDPSEMVISKLNSTVLETWGRERIVTPDMVQGDQLNVRDGIEVHGWPTLGATRDRLIVILHTNGALREANVQGLSSGESSVLFSDAYGDVNAPYAAYHSMNSPIGGQASIRAVVQANHLVRTRADSDGEETVSLNYERANAALDSGAHFISTDFPFAPSEDVYGFTIPLGTPSRCNPIQAPDRCTPQDIEDLFE